MLLKLEYSSGVSDVKSFQFDDCFWSLDPSSAVYTSQQQVYNQLGGDAVASVHIGFNVCVFAYGQIGSGKSHTLVGTQDDPGFATRFVADLLASSYKQRRNFTLTASAMDLYNEQVSDLLLPPDTQKKLRVREHPTSGPFVEDLTEREIGEAAQFDELMAESSTRRRRGKTDLSPDSDRGHTIILLQYREFAIVEGNLVRRSSRIVLADLAGFERISATGSVTDLRLREGGLTNKSLTMFGKCLNALSTRARSGSVLSRSRTGSVRKARKPSDSFVPYRDSLLTWLLKESLGGNSKTFMIATVSPSRAHQLETQSTLNYAERARSIVTAPVANVDAASSKVRELEEQILRLQSEIELLRSRRNKSLSTVDNACQTSASHADLVIASCTHEDIPPEEDLHAALEELRAHAADLEAAAVSHEEDRTRGAERVSELEAMLATLQGQYAELEAMCDALRTELAQSCEVRDTLQAELHSRAEEAAALETLHVQAQQASSALQTRVEDLEAAIHDLEAQMTSLREANASLEQGKREAEEQLDALVDANTALQQANSEAEEQLTSLREANADLAQGKREAEEQLAAQETLAQDHLAVKEQYREQLSAALDRIAGLEAALSDKAQQLEDTEAARASVSSEKEALEAACEQQQTIINSTDSDWKQRCETLQSQVLRLQEELNLNMEQLDRQKLFFRSRFLSQWEDNKPTCTECGRAFTMRLRRHHCRLCGQVYCTHCCKERVATTASRKPVRSCRECADFLAGMEADYAPLEGAVRKLTIPE